MPMNHRLMRPLAGVPSGTPASLLLRFDGANGSTSFVDSSANALTVTANGDSQISTAQSKWGGGSGYFDGDGDYVAIPSDCSIDGTEDFTVECWLRADSVEPATGYTMVLGFEPASGGAFMFGVVSGGAIFAGTAWVDIPHVTTATISASQWHHIAIARSSGTLRIFIDGVEEYSAAETTAFTPQPGAIGGDFGGNSYYNGYIDDFRIVRGLAVYGANGNFTPPTGPLPAVATPQPIQAQASLLLHFDGANGSTTFTDSSVNALAVTAYGNAEISTSQSKWGGSAAYFDGDGDYASVADCDELASSWTVECWLHTPALAGTRAVVSKGAASDVSNCWSVEPDGNALGLYADIGNAIELIATSPEVPVDEWVHLAVVSNNGVVTLFVNGSGGSPSSQVSIASTLGADLIVGAGWYDPASRGFEGYIDDLRIVTGLAVYGANGNFTPPTGPLGATVTPQ